MNKEEKDLLVQQGKKNSQSFSFLSSIIDYSEEHQKRDTAYRFYPLDDDFYFIDFNYTPNYDYLTYEEYGNHHYVIQNPEHETVSSSGVWDDYAYDFHLPHQETVTINKFAHIKYHHPKYWSDGSPMSLQILSIQSKQEIRYFIEQKEYSKDNMYQFLAQYPMLESILSFFKKQELALSLEQDLITPSFTVSQPKL